MARAFIDVIIFLGLHWALTYKLHLFTNALRSLGYGAVFGLHWLYSQALQDL